MALLTADQLIEELEAQQRPQLQLSRVKYKKYQMRITRCGIVVFTKTLRFGRPTARARAQLYFDLYCIKGGWGTG